MPCPPPRPDWGVTFMLGLLMSAFALTIGVVWGQKTGPPKNWMEVEEPPDPPADLNA